VPDGSFRMGDDEKFANVKPAYDIYLLAFYIDKFEVTNAMYKRCVDAGVCQPPRSLGSATRPTYYGNLGYDGYPVINVDWQMAGQFCEWRGARLPTEAEWEKAARGTDARFYPWGEGTDCSFANYTDPAMVCMGDTVPVGSYKNSTSVYGTFDMAGNVLEWVSSLSVPYPYNAVDGREDLTAPGKRVLRGGSWASPVDWISTVFRLPMDPDQYEAAGNDVGFRCASDADS
jgi:formylglycine-generating enzyme required for sulfatase activity